MASSAWIFGLHAVTAALRHDPAGVQGLWVEPRRHDARLRALLETAAQQHIPVHPVERAELDRLSGHARHQGVLARCISHIKEWTEHELPALLEAAQGQALLLVLDGVQDPHNLGACLRSADAAGVQAVLAPADRAVGLTPTVRKVACGAAETVPFIQVGNLARTLRALQQQGLWLIGAAGEAEKTLHEMDFTGPVAIILGAEEKGLRRLTRECCDHLARIPMAGSVESLNVSVATGIFLFEAVRQRWQSKKLSDRPV
ncbi:MAG: 23S rRNA (guanosine(2251)-2'-O)-methyltransferase RlmB [Candidatus Competibacteraceae bacterium]